ncbi:hypothetical protein ACWDVU_09470 [Streptomyces sp. NPDC003333]
MGDELTLLAQAGAAALVTAMATDTWQETRDAVAGLFRRGRRAAVATQLDGGAELVRDAPAPDETRRALYGYWAQELAALLRQDPSCRAALVRLVGDAPADGPGERSWRQTNTARDRGAVYAVQHGDLHVGRPVERPSED